ncbi:AaceriADR119Wp [[Ashbya] aceris (nom. inval.)]|nr:AaceriADR119Wp [[Ashbya] aceris (nom. inval.)]
MAGPDIPGVSKLSLDDLDIDQPPTEFDRQILTGVPMYMEWTGVNIACFPDVEAMRRRYITGSRQDNRSNYKNDLQNWFLYPEPLPKFWKFEHDRRLQLPVDERVSFQEPEFSSRFAARLHAEGFRYTGEYFDLERYAERFRALAADPPQDDPTPEIPTFEAFVDDLRQTAKAVVAPEFISAAEKRLVYLENRYDLFQNLRGRTENLENKSVRHRDFYNTRKVDPNMVLHGCISQRHLNEFICEKLSSEPNRIVHTDLQGKKWKLSDIFQQSLVGRGGLPLSSEDIGTKIVDDEFMDWYKNYYLPNYQCAWVSQLKSLDLSKDRGPGLPHRLYYMIARVFLDFDNDIFGEYLAELVIRYVIHSLEKSKYQLVHLSVDFQFRQTSWWLSFSRWVCHWKLVSFNIRWNVRIKREYSRLYKLGFLDNFEDYLDHIYGPLLDITNIQNVELQFFLSTVVNIDFIVELFDENKPQTESIALPPSRWQADGENPPLAYYMYYVYERLARVNIARHSRKQNSILLRSSPQTDKNRASQLNIDVTEQVESLLCNLLLCNGGILDGEVLWSTVPTVTYLYYILQIPVVVTPLSPFKAPSLKLEGVIQRSTLEFTTGSGYHYRDNPFMHMHRIGMRVILSSNMVLFNSSYTSEPILEEYSVAASIYLLSAADLSEFVRDSIISSGFEGFYKKHWMGVVAYPTEYSSDTIGAVDTWYDESANTAEKHNVPNIRRMYRTGALETEKQYYSQVFTSS